VADAAKANAVTSATLRRAKVKAGVISRKHGNGKDAYWEWRLSGQRYAEGVEDAQSPGVSIFNIFDQDAHLPVPPEGDVGEV